MKKLIVILLSCFSLSITAQTVIPQRAYLVRQVWRGDTIERWMSADTVYYYTNQNAYKFDKPIIAPDFSSIGGIYEPALGNPSTTGYVLSSTTSGVRSWVAQSGGGSTQVEDTIYISSANILSGINDTLVNTSFPTTLTQTIYTTCLISYRHISTAYTGGTTDTIAVFGKYKGVKKKLLYISSSYITDAYSGRGQFPIAWDKLDPGSPIWVHIPAFSSGNGILRMRFKKLTETW